MKTEVEKLKSEIEEHSKESTSFFVSRHWRSIAYRKLKEAEKRLEVLMEDEEKDLTKNDSVY